MHRGARDGSVGWRKRCLLGASYVDRRARGGGAVLAVGFCGRFLGERGRWPWRDSDRRHARELLEQEAHEGSDADARTRWTPDETAPLAAVPEKRGAGHALKRTTHKSSGPAGNHESSALKTVCVETSGRKSMNPRAFFSRAAAQIQKHRYFGGGFGPLLILDR